MHILILSIHVGSAIGLVIAVLLHSPKGEGIGAIGGQARLFRGPKGMESGLNRLTFGLAIVFGVCSVWLGLFS